MTIVALPAGCDQQPATCLLLLGSAWLWRCCLGLLLLAGCWLQAAGWLAGMCGAGAMAMVRCDARDFQHCETSRTWSRRLELEPYGLQFQIF
jgi:hypothetical protein